MGSVRTQSWGGSGWAAQPPLLRLAVTSSVGTLAAVACAESVAFLESAPGVVLVGPVAATASLGAVATYCWAKGNAAHRAGGPSEGLRRVRDTLAIGLASLLSVSVAAPFSGNRRVFTDTGLLILAIATVVIAVALAGTALACGRREQAVFNALNEAGAVRPGDVAEAEPQHVLEGIRLSHGWVAVALLSVTGVLVAVDTSPYAYPLVGLVLVPSVATWAYAALRMSRLERRRMVSPGPDRSPLRFRRARLGSIGVLSMVPVGIFLSMWLSIGESGSGAVGPILAATVAVGLVAAVAYPFFAVAEALRTAPPKPIARELRESDFAEIVTPLDLGFLGSKGANRSHLPTAA